MKKLYLYPILLLLSCNNYDKNKPAIYYDKPTIIVDSLFMEMPGMLYYIDNKLIIWNAFARDYFYQIYDINGNLISNIAPMGRAATEFITPNLVPMYDNSFIITDINKGNSLIYKFVEDSLQIIPNNITDKELSKNFSLTNIDNNLFVTIDNASKENISDKMFNLFTNNKYIESFGKFPIDEKISNRNGVYQGFLGYNKKKKLLLFSSFMIPYFSIYKREGNNFKLIKENKFGDFNYTIDNKKYLKITSVSEPPETSVALLKDYIVLKNNMEEDLNEIPPKTENRKNFNRLSRSLFIYDYNFKLIKIISTKTPIFRLASNPDSNTLFLVTYVNSEFNISKVKI